VFISDLFQVSLYMLQKWLLMLFSVFLGCLNAQMGNTAPEFEAHPLGGREQLEQVLQTQLTLPKSLLTSGFEEEVTLFFDLDSSGKAVGFKFAKGMNNVLRNELKRMTGFLRFKRTQSALGDVQPYFLVFKISTEKYNRYQKQRSRFNLKKSQEAVSSMVIYARADKSPEYFRNGEEGLAEFVLGEIEYPKLAKEKSIEGTVIMEFVVETNGYITNVLVQQGVNGGCTEEAVRIMKQSKWQPAVLNNRLVRYRTIYPITFSLVNTGKDGTSIGN
jgi:TonB family protein